MNRLLLAFALLTVLPGCGEREPSKEPASAAMMIPSPPDFEVRLLEIAQTYELFGRIGKPRWAPQLCVNDRSPPASPEPNAGPNPWFSDSKDPDTHGRKLYWLFVKAVPAGATHGYIPPGEVSRVGQAVVKEAWVPEKVPDKGELKSVTRKVKTPDGERVDRFLPYVRKGDRMNELYRAKEKSALFIMYKLDPKTPGTDSGWVYGTVTADGKKVTSAGRVESCMGCHKDAPHDRIFGLPGKKEDCCAR